MFFFGKKVTQESAIDCTDNYDIILTDSHGIKFVLREYEKPYRHSLVNRECDSEVFAVYKKLLKQNDIVFDVGAHIGRYSVYPSRLIGENGFVYSFEPVQDNYWQLKTTIALNRCTNVISINKAVGDKICKAQINLFDKEYSSWSTFGMPEMVTPEGKKVKPSRVETVECETIDNFCLNNKIHHINFLKIDVEGFEYEVMLGACSMLSRHDIDYICFEISEIPLHAAGSNSKCIFDLFHNHSYQVYKYNFDNNKFDVSTLSDLFCFHGNFYASHFDLTEN